jgi:hypothetical protein
MLLIILGNIACLWISLDMELLQSYNIIALKIDGGKKNLRTPARSLLR